MRRNHHVRRAGPWRGGAAALALLCACSGPEVHEATVIHSGGEPSASVIEEVDDLEVQDHVVRQVAGRTTAQFILVNGRDEPLRLQLRWEWRDEDGIALRPATGEKPEDLLVLLPRQRRPRTFLSPTEKAVQFVAWIEEIGPGEGQ